MRGRTTFLTVCAVVLMALATTAGITLLHQRASRARARYEALIEVEASANRLGALDWEAEAQRSLPLSVESEVNATLPRMRAQLAGLLAAGTGIEAPLRAFDAYRPALEAEHGARRVRDFESAESEEQIVQIRYADLLATLRAAAARNARMADRAERLAWIGSAAVILLSALGLAGLLLALERAARRRQRAEELLRDGLTGLPNRAYLEQRIAEAAGAAVVALIDLDDFKRVNDSLGHGTGDELLTIVGRRLRNVVRADDVVARLGGDEFAVLATHLEDRDAFVERLFGALAEPVALGGKQLHLRASVGVADSGADLLRNADLAMYAAKASGSNRCALFSEDMHVEALARLDRREQLERAIAREELVLHYQPIVALDGGAPVGFEALVRWQHPERGLLGPGEFIPLAEESGLIVPLGAWVLRQACHQAAGWPGAPYISVNVASGQLEQAGFEDEVASALAESGLPAERLVIELTERSLVGAAEGERLQALRRLGVRLAIDDFGTGYSSLDYLRRFPMDVLKIDRSFTRGAAAGDPLLRAIVAMGRSLGLVLVPEGIEDAAQGAALHALGCELGQGFHYGRPAPPSSIAPHGARADRAPAGVLS
jgi:diguanylate cyclase (GGDEF)-like protein